jgi:hypothetical protein
MEEVDDDDEEVDDDDEEFDVDLDLDNDISYGKSCKGNEVMIVNEQEIFHKKMWQKEIK